MADASAVEETFKRLQSHKGVIGVVVINADGIAIKSTFDNDVTVQYAALVSHFTTKSRSVVRKLDPDNDLKFLRLRCAKSGCMHGSFLKRMAGGMIIDTLGRSWSPSMNSDHPTHKQCPMRSNASPMRSHAVPCL